MINPKPLNDIDELMFDLHIRGCIPKNKESNEECDRFKKQLLSRFKSAFEGLRADICECEHLLVCDNCAKVIKWLPDLFIEKEVEIDAGVAHVGSTTDISSSSNIYEYIVKTGEVQERKGGSASLDSAELRTFPLNTIKTKLDKKGIMRNFSLLAKNLKSPETMEVENENKRRYI